MGGRLIKYIKVLQHNFNGDLMFSVSNHGAIIQEEGGWGHPTDIFFIKNMSFVKAKTMTLRGTAAAYEIDQMTLFQFVKKKRNQIARVVLSRGKYLMMN